MTPAERVYSCLCEHQGRDQAITAPGICKRLGWSRGREREVRRMIAGNANKAWLGVLCAVPGLGYFFASDMEEIATYRKYLVGLRKQAAIKVTDFDKTLKREGFALQEAA
jgi:hypothetical protein